ncbi:hypothetical protein [Paenibacillus marinisediminis]
MKMKWIGNSKEAVERELAKIGIIRTTKENRLKHPFFSEVIRPLDQRKSNK